MLTLSLLGDMGRKIVISVEESHCQPTSDPRSEGMIPCTAEVDMGSFRGVLADSLTLSALPRLLSELDRLLDGTISDAGFATVDQGLQFDIEMSRRGGVVIAGTLEEYMGAEVKLAFRFESDRGFLAAARSDLKRIVGACSA